MKHTIIFFALLMSAFAANAKKTISTIENETTISPQLYKPFMHTKFELGNTAITFSMLPKHTTYTYILDAGGRIISSGTISRKNNSVNIKQLQPGTYTIVLQQGSTVQMYGYTTGALVTACRR